MKTWRQGDWNTKYQAVQKRLFRRHSSMALTKPKSRKRKTFRSMSTPNNFGNPTLVEESEEDGKEKLKLAAEELKLEADEDILYFEAKKDHDEFFNLIPSQKVEVELCDDNNCDSSEFIELTFENSKTVKRKLEYEDQNAKFRKTEDIFDVEDNIWTFLESSMDKPDCESDGFPSKSSSSETSSDDDEDPSDKRRHIFYPEETPNDLMTSDCWPRDWIPQDYPGARVICISYTTDRYLWRPVWMKPYYRYDQQINTPSGATDFLRQPSIF